MNAILKRMKCMCYSYTQHIFRKYVFTFNALLLIFLTLQSTGFVLLSTYVQQRKIVTTGEKKSFTPSHFLMFVECTKLVLSLFWAAMDVRNKMKQGASSQVITQGKDSEVIVEESSPSRLAPSESARKPQKPRCNTVESLDKLSSNIEKTFAVHLDEEADDKHVVVYKFPPNSRTKSSLRRFFSEYWCEVSLCQNNYEGFMMLLPAVWYGIQNYFIINALRMLDPVTYQLCYQIRIPLTALVMYVSLGTSLNSQRWLAIIILFLGVILGQAGALSSAKEKPSSAPKGSDNSSTNSTYERYVMGLISVVVACTLSSISSVYMEWIFKKRSHRCLLSVRNIHLSFFSILYFVFLGVNECLSNRSKVVADPFVKAESLLDVVCKFLYSYLTGFDYLVVILILFHACGGIIVALVMRYSDNIMKSFSIGASILLSGVGSIVLFDSHFNMLFLLASILVIASIFIYNSA